MSLVEIGARYVLTNSALGPSLALASTLSNASLVVEPLRSSSDSQLWFVTATDDKERFYLHTVQNGVKSTRVISYNLLCPPVEDAVHANVT